MPGSARRFPWPGLVPARVVRVVDGDTFVAEVRGAQRRIRLIGVDAPETVKPRAAVEPYGPEASAYTGAALGGRLVYLEYDIERTDRYGRDLCYVWLDEATLFNEALVREGYARVSTYRPNTRYLERFEAQQRRAQWLGAGMYARAGG